MESLGQIIVSVAIAATTAFGGFNMGAEAHSFWGVPQSPSVGYLWSARIVKLSGDKIPAIFTHPDLAVGLLTLVIIGARLKLKR